MSNKKIYSLSLFASIGLRLALADGLHLNTFFWRPARGFHNQLQSLAGALQYIRLFRPTRMLPSRG